MKLSCVVLLTAAICLLSLGVAACAKGPGIEAGAADATYRVRGEVRALPPAGGREISIRHEAIADFRDPRGKVVGMESMTMPFTLAPGVDLTGIEPGDRLRFTLEVRWEGRDPVVVYAIEELAPETRLGFDPPPQEAGATPR